MQEPEPEPTEAPEPTESVDETTTLSAEEAAPVDEQPETTEDPQVEEIDLEGLDVTHDFARGKALTVIRTILASPTPQAA